MKKTMKSIALVFLLGLSIQAIATAPCHTTFAVQAAYIDLDYIADLGGCEGSILEGPCKDEAAAKRTHNLNIALSTWSQCCCVYGLSCCGG